MLALNFTTCVVNGCSQIRFTETTGIDYTTSATGPSSSFIPTIATLSITKPDNTIITINLFTLGFPSNNNDFYYDISVNTLGLIPDGVYTFTYTVSDGIVSHTKTKTSLFYCKSECCVAQMLGDLDLDSCDCCDKNTNYDNYILASTYLESLKNAAKCGNINSFNKIKKIVDKLCKNKDCNTCK